MDNREIYRQTTSTGLWFRHHLVLWLYLAGFVLAELNSNGQRLVLGLIIHACLLVALLTQGVVSENKIGKLYTAMAIIPLIRLLSLSMPFWLTDRTGYFAMVNLPLIVSTVVAIYILGYRLQDFSFSFRYPFQQVLVIFTSLVIGTLERLIIQPEPLAKSLALQDVILPMLSLMLFTGLSEELLFRGILQKTATEALGTWPGILYISALFGIMHIGWNSFLDVIFVSLVGVYFAWIVHHTKSLLGVTIAHGFANIMLFIIIPLGF